LKVELENILKQDVHLLFASRTDAGVHADGNVCAFDAELPFPAKSLQAILNSRLGNDLDVREVRETAAEFHPRYGAVNRRYVYRIWNSSDVPVDRKRYCAQVDDELDEAPMLQFMDILPGLHSFASFCTGTRAPDKARCKISAASLIRRGDDWELWFGANRFLHNMVCRLAGALIAVGNGSMQVEELAAGLNERVVFRFKPAPAKGLTLREIAYPQETGGPVS
jgi:tRNA pseudouridine38-40 synthase